MSRISDLDKVLDYVRHFSINLAPIQDGELSMNVDIEIDLLVEYLEELKNRGYISYDRNGSYITLQGRMALENAKNSKPFQEELGNKRIKKIWSITKIIAAVLNGIAIISIAIWSQLKSDKKNDLETEIRILKQTQKSEQIEYSNQIDSLKTIIYKLENSQTEDSIIEDKRKHPINPI